MIRILLAFVVLFLGALAGLTLLPTPPHTASSRSAVAAELHAEAQPAAATKIRVVYPGPSDSPSLSQPQVDAAPAPEAVAGGAPVPASPVVTPPDATVANAGDAVTRTPAGDPVQAGAASLNLNTASVDALNDLPGAGRIGRTIASHRPYKTVEDLLTRRVLRKSVYDKIKDRLAAE